MSGAVAPRETNLRILHVFPSFAIGGQQKRFLDLAQALGEAFSHQVVSLDGDLSAAGPIQGVEYFADRSRSASPLPLDPQLIASLIRRIEISAAHLLCTYNFGSLEAAVANRLSLRLPHVHHEDGFGPGETPLTQKRRRVLFRRFLLRKSTTIVPSGVLDRVAREIWRLPKSRVMQIANGVDADRFHPRAGEPSDIPGVHVGSVGALRPEKNYLRLIRAFEAAHREKDRLTIIGAGPEESLLRAAATGLPVELPGGSEKPELSYREFDIFALSSDTEQMPLSLLEAMASGLPVVATDVGDVAKMVSQENRRFVVPAVDEAAFVSALAALRDNPLLRRELGAANRLRAVEHFPLSRMIDRCRQAYLDAAERAA